MNLRNLKDDQLEVSFKTAVLLERQSLHLVVEHIQEVSRRQLYLKKAYASLFDYLIKVFGYSNAAAQRRIEAARLASEIPGVSEKIISGELNLTQIAEIQRSVRAAEKFHFERINPEVKAYLVEQVMNQTTEATQKTCAELLSLPAQENQKIITQADDSKRIEITLTEEQFKKFEQVKGLIANKNFLKRRSTNFADILETCFDYILEKELGHPKRKNPSPKNKNLDSRNEKPQGLALVNDSSIEKPVAGSAPSQEPELRHSTSAPEVEWKSLTPKRRKFILKRDQACQYTDEKTGRKCNSHFQMEVDHIQEKHKGGNNNPVNLRGLCRKHNQYRFQYEL